MKNKYTAGPWENCNGDIRAKWETGEDITICNTGSTRFCGNESGGPKDKRMKAEDKGNAELIAAAPDMAEALAEVRDMLESSNPTNKRKADIHFIVTAALAKAGR